VNGWFWIGAGVVLAIGEAFVPGITLIWIGAAAALVGLISLAWPEIGWAWQVALFAVLAAAAVATGLWLRNHPREPMTSDVNRGTARFVGQLASLDTAIVNGRGEIRFGDTLWPVAGPDLPAGTSVRITGTDGTTLQVSPVS